MHKSIRVLKLPLGLLKKLENQNIYYIDELISNFANISLNENELDLLKQTLNSYKKTQLLNELVGYVENNNYDFLDQKYKLDDLNLSLRSINALTNYGITKVSKLFNIIEELEVYNIDNLGSKSLIQVLESAYEIVKKENLFDVIPIYSSINNIDDVSILNMDFTKGAIESLIKFGLNTLGDIRKVYLSGKLSTLFNYKTLGVIINKLKKYYDTKLDSDFYFLKLFLIEEKLGLISLDELNDLLTKNNLNIPVTDVITKLKDRNDFVILEDAIRLPYFLEILKHSKLKKESEEIILERFKGNTLQSVADKFNKTRERIRQIVRDRMMQIRMFYEEAFVKEYLKFSWHPKVFMKLFDLDEISFNVIKYLADKPSVDEDFTFPEEHINELINNGIVKNINIDDFKDDILEIFPQKMQIYGKVLNKLTKREFLEYVIENFIPKEGMHKNNIIEIANKVAIDNNIEYHYDKFIDIVTNIIQGLQHVRFYDYSIIDDDALNSFKKILYEVDSVYSCTYFYLKYPELMKKYDIRDGYELHFLLRKYFALDDEITKLVDFNRQPMLAKKGLTFSDLVYLCWKELTKITTVDDFANELIERFGFHKGTLINIINSTLGDYISLRRIYPFEAKLDDGIKAKVKEILTDDFYEVTELANIFETKGIKQEQYLYFSNTWLKEFGYKTHDINYIIKEEFSSLKEVFYNRVLKEDIYKLTKKDHMMRDTTLILFIESLREEYLAFPIKGRKLVTMKYLEKKGIKKEDIISYVNELAKYIKPEKYFTYYSLKKENYQKKNPIFQKVEDFNLDSSLMVAFIRNVPGVKKTTKGNLYRISKKPSTISEFLDYISKTQNIDDPKELKRYVKENYGFSIRLQN